MCNEHGCISDTINRSIQENFYVMIHTYDSLDGCRWRKGVVYFRITRSVSPTSRGKGARLRYSQFYRTQKPLGKLASKVPQSFRVSLRACQQKYWTTPSAGHYYTWICHSIKRVLLCHFKYLTLKCLLPLLVISDFLKMFLSLYSYGIFNRWDWIV